MFLSVTKRESFRRADATVDYAPARAFVPLINGLMYT